MNRYVVSILITTSLVVAGCGGKDEPTKQAATKTQAGCKSAQLPEPKTVDKRKAPELKLDSSKKYVVKVKTNCGEFEITLDSKVAPKTGGSFVTLVREGFYDGLTFHRIVPGFVIQGGDPEGTGTGGPGYSVKEKPPADVEYTEGVVAMAKAGPEPAGTSGSQFYVVTGADAGLPAEYALLGKVTRGLDVAHKIEEVEVQADEAPVDPVVIEKMTVKEP